MGPTFQLLKTQWLDGRFSEDGEEFGTAARQDLGPHLDRLTAPQPRGPVTQGHLKRTGIQDAGLDTFSSPDDENARSAVLLRFPCEQCHAGVSAWLRKTLVALAPADMPVRIHFGTTSARLVCSTRAKCQEFVATHRDEGLPYSIDSPF